MSKEQLLEQAGIQIRGLAEGAGIRPIAMAIDLAEVGSEMLPSLLSHELVAGHAAMMRLMSKLDLFLGQITADRPPAEQDRACRQAVQLSTAAARLTERYRLGLMSIARLEGWMATASRRRKAAADPGDLGDDDPFDDGPGGGRRQSPAKALARLQALNRSMAAMLKTAPPNGAQPAAPQLNGNGTHLQGPPAEASAKAGRLKHGNPSGDLRAAPRCGARTRAACACRQPAMANGRCRFHGGKSTGARNAAGLARCRTASLRHGHRTAEIIELKSAAARHGRALHALTRAARVQSERATPCPAKTEPFVGATGRSPVVQPHQIVAPWVRPCRRDAGDLPVAPTTRIRASHPMSSDVVRSALPAGPAACYEMPRVNRLKRYPDREPGRRFRRRAAA